MREGSQRQAEALGGELQAESELQPNEEQHLGGSDHNDTPMYRKIILNVFDLNWKVSFKYAGTIFILIAPR